MPELSDDEKVAAILGDVELEESRDETIEENNDQIDEEERADSEESESQSEEEEKPQDEEEAKEESAESTFTKQFPNLKGESLEEYVPELEKAYDNSFKEALRLNQIIKDNADKVAEANRIIAQAQQGAPTNPVLPPPADNPNPNPTVPPPAASLSESPEIEWIRNERRRVMMTAFDDFKAQYPQVLDAKEFERFRLATDGVKAALVATEGREPTDAEIFESTARTFGWQPAVKEDRKNAVIKENASSTRSSSGQSKPAPKKSKISDDQVDAYLRMFTGKTREEAVKELEAVV